MANFTIGQVVTNFGVTAKVIGFFDRPGTGHDGDPILREIGPNGKLRGGKWVADPAKCQIVEGGR